ncbi:MAG: hypothetical protein KME20_00400 [Kaiparowitsia implicata GSE-PSE-MK54-09C]|jgi:alcohol dehydrogenase YqhD (iron-dependent ADH family)|nr:hypothetical protein [Kaiparowitsia implicata GSE-PSE-MK54-09C]
MKSPLVNAFFVGRALAEALGEQTESLVTNTLSELGKFDAEQRERLRNFTEQVLEKASREEDRVVQEGITPTSRFYTANGPDLQATVDELRAEIAQLRTELQSYRSLSN